MERITSLGSTCELDLTKAKNDLYKGQLKVLKLFFFNKQHAVTLDNIRNQKRKNWKIQRVLVGKALWSSVLCTDNTVGVRRLTGDMWHWAGCTEQLARVTLKWFLGSSEQFQASKTCNTFLKREDVADDIIDNKSLFWDFRLYIDHTFKLYIIIMTVRNFCRS